MSTRQTDPRAWLLWAAALMLPAFVGRNPFPLVCCLIVAAAVWYAHRIPFHSSRNILLVGMWLAGFGIAFNVLTVHAGNLVIGTLPSWLPLVGGPITMNALLYGVCTACALFVILLVGVTMSAVLDWMAIVRMMPDRLAPIASIGAVAWTLLPQTGRALAEIREAQIARGHRPRGIRDAAPLVVPLLAGGIERSTMLGEALEARAFGAPTSGERSSTREQLMVLAAAATGLLGAYVLMLGGSALAGILLVSAVMVGWLATRSAPMPVRRTRFRTTSWDRRANMIALPAAVALIGELVLLSLSPGAYSWEPYPVLTVPVVNVPLLVCVSLLLSPLMVEP